MRICPISINQINCFKFKTSNSIGLSSCNQTDVFVKSCSFGVKDDKSFNEFKKWAKETDFTSHVSEIIDRTGDILGSGFEGTTYSIPNNDKWVIKQYNRSKVVPEALKKPLISEVKDISPDLNIGQFVASVKIPMNDRLSQHIYILKKQTGRSHGIPHSSNKIVNDATAKQHIDSLKRLAQMPMETYTALVDDITYVTKQGYKFDTDNPYNFMIDFENNRVRFVDIADKLEEKDKTQYGDVLFALLDSDFARTFKDSDRPEKEKASAKMYSYQICSKFVSAMVRKKAKFTSSHNFTKVFVSEPFEFMLGTSRPDKKIAKLKELGLY